jgi:hypothetical protein
MAEIARGHGLDVEIAAFEGWDPTGRVFDRVVSAQAWHWLDLPIATAKAAAVLRSGGRLGLIWNAGYQPDDLADALEEVYARVVPRGGHRLFRGMRPTGHGMWRPGSNRRSTPSARCPTSVHRRRSGSRGRGPTRGMSGWACWSHHTALEPSVRDRLFEAIGAVIDAHSGSFVMNFETILITATRLGNVA